jgi:hypothetical protein
LLRVLLKMAVLRKGWRNCPVSDCRRARACMGRKLNCLFTVPDPAVTWTQDEIAQWQKLADERREHCAVLRRMIR